MASKIKNFIYLSSIRTVAVQLLNVFSGIQVYKFNNSNDIIKIIDVPIKYSTKEKFYWWIYDRKHESYLPMMSLHLTNLAYDSQRSTERGAKLNLKLNYKDSNQNISEKEKDSVLRIFRPTPYRFSYQLNIGTVYLNEADQILEQILPFFDPWIQLKVKIPLLDYSYDATTIISSLSPDISEEYSDDSYRIVKWSMDLDVSGYIFKPIEKSSIIEKINMPFYGELKHIEYVEGSETLKLDKDKKTFFEGNKDKEPNEILSVEGLINESGEVLANHEIYKEDPNNV